MSKVAIVGDPSGTGTFTISAPNGNTDRTLVLPDEAGTVLTSGTPTLLPKGVPTFFAYRGTSNQSISSNTFTKILFADTIYDTHGFLTSSSFQPTIAGYYLLNCELDIGANSGTLARCNSYFQKNGSKIYWGNGPVGGFVGNEYMTSHSQIIYLNGTTDYAEVGFFGTGTNIVAYGSASSYVTVFSGVLVRAD